MNKPLPGSWRCSYFDQNPPLFLRTDGSTTQRNKDGEEVMITNTCSINSCRSNKCLQVGIFAFSGWSLSIKYLILTTYIVAPILFAWISEGVGSVGLLHLYKFVSAVYYHHTMFNFKFVSAVYMLDFG
ncbi:uncharacterized protein LOC131032498 [Cryptomeria japonica]|uniref:uncharacterized protein LOC131032498 n=1 Tax=Cryptomeria japonica TaxID=3369 RepID=UPI0025AC1100|nr:uncharacterized protein LOC131032498 [Cryptomeria japonica]